MLRWNILQYLTKMLRQYFNCNEIQEIFLTYFCNILCYVSRLTRVSFRIHARESFPYLFWSLFSGRPFFWWFISREFLLESFLQELSFDDFFLCLFASYTWSFIALFVPPFFIGTLLSDNVGDVFSGIHFGFHFSRDFFQRQFFLSLFPRGICFRWFISEKFSVIFFRGSFL